MTEIKDKVKLKNPFLLETYILCPNTIYQMGTFDVTTYRIVNGSQPIYTRSNSIYQCGEDGKSSNNCIISGGEYHVFHEYATYGRDIKVNVVMKGFTFEHASGSSLIIAAPGDITFIDCIFRNHENTGIKPLLYSYVSSRRLKAITVMQEEGGNMGRLMKYYHDILHDPVKFQQYKDDAARSHQRRLQGGGILEFQNVIVDGCVFENNGHGPDSMLTIDGMIYLAAASNALTVKNTIFRNNSFTTPVNGRNGFAASAVANATMTFSDVCFLDNKFIGSGVVVVEGSSEDFVSSGVTGTIDPTLDCTFASIGFDSCVEYDSNTCSALNPVEEMNPTVAPLITPVSVPVVTPIASPVTTPALAPISVPAAVTAPSTVVTPMIAPVESPVLAPVTGPVAVSVPSAFVAPAIVPAGSPMSSPAAVPTLKSPTAPTNTTSPSTVTSPTLALPKINSPALSPLSAEALSLAPSNALYSKKGNGMKMMNKNGMSNGLNGSGKNNSNGKDSGTVGVGSVSGKGSNTKGMGMMMNMGRTATDDKYIPALEEDIILGVQGNSIGSGIGSMSTVPGGGKGAKLDKRGPEGQVGGMMMKSTDLDSISSSPPKSKRNMFRQGKNNTNPSKLMDSIMHALHHSNVSVMELNHTLSEKKETERNSTIGTLLERFRKGLHHDKNSTSSNNTQLLQEESNNENESKFPRLSYIWEKLMDGVNSEKVDGTETSTIGTKLWKWFHGKN